MSERKILYSPGYGAGWVSWCDHPDVKRYMLTYQPIIDALERGEKLDKEHPLCKQLERECLEKFGEAVYVAGAHQLKVMTVTGRVRIEEYDGSESVIEERTDEGWM